MARFHDKVGFVRTVEYDPVNHPSVYKEVAVEKYYYGDILRRSQRWNQNGGGSNDNLVIDNTISIIADDFANKNYGAMRYVRFFGNLWEISSAESQRPRIILTLGGLYNGPTPEGT